MLSRGLKVFFICLISFWASPTVAQDIDVNNLQKVNVDELSDEQIQRFIDELDKRGITDEQFEVLARSRGISQTQISKLKVRVRRIRFGRSGSTKTKNLNRLRTDQLPPDSTRFDFFSVLEVDSTELKEPGKLEIFGMDFFRNPNLTFQPNLNIPTPKNYILGSGDNLLIDIWGASEQNYELTISPEGAIVIPNLGPILIAGITIEEATKKINSRLRNIYSGLGRNTFSHIGIGRMKSIQVHVTGEIMRPGTYTVNSFSTVLNTLYSAQGPKESGALRAIDVFRAGKQVATIDIYDFLIGGSSENIVLQDQDIIIIRPYLSRIAIDGEVKRPAIYELKENETLERLIKYAGGFSDRAYRSSVTVRRINGLKRSITTVEESSYRSFLLKQGDEVFVSEIIDRFENRVQIYGAVNMEGDYELTDKLTLKDLINEAEGLREDAFLQRGVIVRMNTDLSLSTVPFNLSDILKGNSKPIYLENGDYVKIQSIFDLRENQTVSLEGEVIEPGEYPFTNEMTVEDLIFLSGGFKESAAKSFVEVARRLDPSDLKELSKTSEIFTFPIEKDLVLSDQASQFKLEPFDLVLIRKSPNYFEQQMVEVEGEINFPGKYAIESKTERISDLLERSGGITSFAYVKGATLIRRTEYYEEDDAKAAEFKRQNLKELAERDSTLEKRDLQIRTQESIGINLTEIIKNPKSKYDLIIKEGDVLSIPKKLETVRMRGELLYPSTTRYERNMSFKDYISQAGGFGDRARKGKSYVVYANGAAARTKKLLFFNNYPKLEPGAEIIVPTGPEKRRIRATEILSIGNVAITMGWVIVNLLDSLGQQ